MKLSIALVLAVVLTAFGSLGADTNLVSAEGFASVPDFEFRVEMHANSAVLEAIQGVSWVDLSWSYNGDGLMEFWVDETGVASNPEDLQGTQFLIHFIQSAEGTRMSSESGTSWRLLSFGCGGDVVCRYAVDENGVVGL